MVCVYVQWEAVFHVGIFAIIMGSVFFIIFVCLFVFPDLSGRSG
jgi:hypothetical protein